MKVLVIGLGKLGSMIAKRLSVSPEYSVYVWNRSPDASLSHSKTYGTIFTSELSISVSAVDYVVSVVTDSAAVSEILKSLRESRCISSALWIDATSGDPSQSVSNACIASDLGMSFIDCAVSGGPRGAESGTLMGMVGGSIENVERARPLLSLMTRKFYHLGPIGAGHAVKAVNNTLLAAHMLLASEALGILKNKGVDINLAAEVISGSSGGSHVMSDRMIKYVLNSGYDYGFSMAGLSKDVKIGTNMTDDMTSLLKDIEKRTSEALETLGPTADHTEIAKLFNI